MRNALSKDARKNGDSGTTSFQSVLLYLASPSKYEIAGQSEEYLSNHHLCESNAVLLQYSAHQAG